MNDVLIVFVLMVTVLLRLALVVAVLYLLLPRGAHCPNCHIEMIRIHSPLFDRLVRVVERRWCMQCGWHGIVRRGPPMPRAPSPEEQPTPPTWE